VFAGGGGNHFSPGLFFFFACVVHCQPLAFTLFPVFWEEMCRFFDTCYVIAFLKKETSGKLFFLK